jgi:hypothetical protein
MICGAPAILNTTAPYAPRSRPAVTAEIGWQIVQQNNDLIKVQAADPMHSRACDDTSSITP